MQYLSRAAVSVTYETEHVQAALTNAQRLRIAEMEGQIAAALAAHKRAVQTLREVLAGAGASDTEKMLASVAMLEVAAHLMAPVPPIPDAELPPNVKRLVASGRSGPRFKEPLEQYALGPSGLKAAPRPVAHAEPCDPAVCGRSQTNSDNE